MSKYKVYRLQSGLNYSLEEKLYNEVCSNDEDGTTYTMFDTYINASPYFVSIFSYIALMVALFSGYTSFIGILITNLLAGVISQICWNIIPLYRIPGLALVVNILGHYIFRFMIHLFIVVGVAIWYFHDLKIVIFVAIARTISLIIESLMSGYKYTENHNNEVAKYTIAMINNVGKYKATTLTDKKESKYCLACGKPIDNEWKYCKFCGKNNTN